MDRSKENKKLLEQGSKYRAGRLLSGYLRAIAQEVTELVDVVVGPDEVERRLVSKAEALARDMMRQALEGVDDKLKLEYRKLILDRIEGRAGDADSNNKPGRSVPDRVSEINKERMNAIASEIAEEED